MVVIRACALLTPLGDVNETWNAMCAGRAVERQRAIADPVLSDTQESPGLDRSIQIALAVARRAIQGLPGGQAREIKLFCGTSKGPIGAMLDAYETVRRGQLPAETIARQVALGVGAMGVILAERLGLDGPAHTSVAACSSGLHALHRAACELRSGMCSRALVVAADASLHELFEASFARLGVLAPLEDVAGADGPVRRCRPFSADGAGFFLSEAGAAVVLDRVEGEENGVRLEYSWIGADGTALVAMDTQTRALRAGIGACTESFKEPLAFVHAHATGTRHDAHELAAIRAVAGSGVPVFSHKGHLGHSLGAAGLVSAVLSVMCHEKRLTWTGLPVRADASSVTIAQGFGGHIGLVRLRGK